MSRSLSLSLLCAMALVVAASSTPAAPAPAASPSDYQVVVHPNNPATALDRRFLEDAFLKKIKAWPGGEVIRALDREPTSEVRRRFSAEVLRRPVEAVRAYWQQRIFSGRDVPPPELESDEAVLRYVLKYPGSLGYVSRGIALGGAKAIAVR